MRRPPATVWILAPLALAILYALVWPLFAPTPTVASLVPKDAVFTMRFKDLAALDKAWYRPKDDPARPSELIAANRNVAGLPGVDPHRPFFVVYVPREQRPDPSIIVLPVGDASRLEARFEDPSFFLEEGHIRHAQYLDVKGDWAAIGGDREAVRHLGEGGLTGADLGEDQMVAIDVPGLARFALLSPREPPWDAILAALGFDPKTAATDASGAAIPVERIVRVASAWKEARLWAFFDEGRMRFELVPAPGPLADRLAALPSPAAGALPPLPPRSQAWLAVRGPRERAALAWTLWSAGVPFPEDVGTRGAPLGAWGDADAFPHPLLIWASPAIGTGYAWTLGLASPGTLPPLDALLPAVPDPGDEVSIGAGLLPLTLADLQHDRVAPAGTIRRRALAGHDVLALGPTADDALQLFAEASEAPPPPTLEPGWHEVATFFLDAARARAILGDEVETGGFLAALAGGPLQGVLSTDGRVLRIDVRRLP